MFLLSTFFTRRIKILSSKSQGKIGLFLQEEENGLMRIFHFFLPEIIWNIDKNSNLFYIYFTHQCKG